jgi:hypothetical protein
MASIALPEVIRSDLPDDKVGRGLQKAFRQDPRSVRREPLDLDSRTPQGAVENEKGF